MDGVEPGHSIVVCIRCRGRRAIDGQPGRRLLPLLQALFDGGLTSGFRLAEAECMAGCGRPLTVAYTAPGKASCLFGDIEPGRDAPHLIDFARLCGALPDGWCKESQRPPGLAGKTLARIPAAPIAGGAR
jgi:predicted metal-binding protein